MGDKFYMLNLVLQQIELVMDHSAVPSLGI